MLMEHAAWSTPHPHAQTLGSDGNSPAGSSNPERGSGAVGRDGVRMCGGGWEPGAERGRQTGPPPRPHLPNTDLSFQ